MKTLYKNIKTEIQNGYGATWLALVACITALILAAFDALS